MEIDNFWKFCSEKLPEFDINEYISDIELNYEKSKIFDNWKDYAMLLSSSSVIYMNMLDLFAEINKINNTKIIFSINPSDFIIHQRSPELIKKICDNLDDVPEEKVSECTLVMTRIWLIITSSGNRKEYEMVEKIYEKSLEYNYGVKWQVIKYYPSSTKQFYISYKDEDIEKTILPNSMSYIFNDGKIVIFSDEKNIIAMNSSIVNSLISLFGEYLVVEKISGACVLPNIVAFPTFPATEMYDNLKDEIFGKHKSCSICEIMDFHCAFTDLYCSFCIQGINLLNET